MVNPLAQDLDHVLAHTGGLWEELRGQRIFITGGTGFFGCWLLESFAWANEKLGLDATAVVLSRNPEAFRAKAPHLAGIPAISFYRGDVRSFEFPSGNFSHVIHAATESSITLKKEDALPMFDAIVLGSRRALDFAVACGAKKFLLTSSGAVYGPQPAEMARVTEEYKGAADPMDFASAYGEGKRAAELLSNLYSQKHGFEAKIARGFSFVGPYQPLDAHFAIGNFIRDALAGQPIRIKGDGMPRRSYLYAADLAVWLWTILLRGESCRPYNVGSETSVTIAELGRLVARVLTKEENVSIAQAPGVYPARGYVPSTARAFDELNLRTLVSLEDAILRTARWHVDRKNSIGSALSL